MRKEAVQVVAESEHLSISKKLINKFSKRFGLSRYQTERAETIANDPSIQYATKEYSVYMEKYRKRKKRTTGFIDKGFDILNRLRDIINQVHPITKNQPEIYYVSVIAIEHTQNQVEE